MSKIRILCSIPTIKLLCSNFRIKIEKLMSVFWFFGPFFDYFFYCPKFQKWNFIKNPWYTKILTLYDIDFPQKIGFFRFFLRKLSVYWRFYTFLIENTPQIFKKSTFPYTPIYYIFVSEFNARSNNQTIGIFPIFFLRKFLLTRLYTLFMVQILIIFFIVQSLKN